MTEQLSATLANREALPETVFNDARRRRAHAEPSARAAVDPGASIR